jgi:hypothetical protein
MKIIRRAVLGGLVLAASLYFVQAQQMVSLAQSAQPVTAATDDTSVMLQAIEQVAPVPASSLPQSGTFWSAQHAPGSPEAWPPLPANMWGLPAWPLGDGVFLLNDTNLDYDALAAVVAAAQPAASPMMQMSMMSSSLSTAYAYGNPVYLANLTKSLDGYGNLIFGFSVFGGTNFVPWDIEMSTNIASPNWTWQGIAYTSNSYAFYGQPSGIAFYRLVNPSKTMTVGFGDDTVGQCDVPFTLTNVVQVAGGGGQSIALKTDGTAVGWGQNYYGQATVPTNLTGIAMVAAGWYHSLAMLTNGTVVAWGISSSPLFGGLNVTNVPASLTNAIVISAQALHSLALTSNGTVVAWGYDGGAGVTNVPAGLSNVVAIAAGYMHNLAVTTNGGGTVVAWGNNGDGQCSVPAGLSNVVDVAAGAYHSLALLQNGTVAAWGDDFDGETDVPAGLTNVVAIAASGDPGYAAYSMALKSDGTVVVWGDDEAADPVSGLNNVIGIAAGADHALAIRTGPATPVVTLEPVDEYQVQGGNATFTARGAGLYGVAYQWQTNGVNLWGATNATLTLTNVQPPAQLASYSVIVGNEVGGIASSNAYFTFVTPPVIVSQTMPTNQVAIYLTNLTLNVVATAPGIYNGFPLSYQWKFNGTNIAGATSASYTVHATANAFGTYSVQVNNAAGSTNATWQVSIYYPSGLLITQQPTNQYQIAGGTINFYGGGVSSNAVTYQWAFNGTNISGANNATLTLTNVQATNQGYYNFTINDGVGSVTSSNAYFYLVTPPVITSQSSPTNFVAYYQTNLALSATANAPGITNGFQLAYQWQFNGTNISGQTATNYTFVLTNSGTYSLIVSNAAGSTNAVWQVTINYGTLAYYLSTNTVSRTNGISDVYGGTMLLSGWNYASYTGTNLAFLTNAVWSTNFWLKGVQGLSATCIGYSNGLGGQGLITMVSPRHYLFATHMHPEGALAAFLDTNNVIYWRTTVQRVDVTNTSAGDTSVGILNADLPSSVGFLSVLPSNFTNYLPTTKIIQCRPITSESATFRCGFI